MSELKARWVELSCINVTEGSLCNALCESMSYINDSRIQLTLEHADGKLLDSISLSRNV